MTSGAHNKMCLTVPNLSQNVSLCRMAIAAFASQIGFTLAEIEEIKVAVSEAVTNCVLHAYDRNGEIRLTATLEGNTLTVVVSDDGRGIADLPKAREACYTSIEGRMGLGFCFLESLADELQVTSEPGRGTTVCFKKHAHKSTDALSEHAN